MIQPLLSIIIINYNTADITLNCLKSITADVGLTLDLSTTPPNRLIPTEIIVVDNNSTDNSVNLIKKTKIPVTLIENKNNSGFGKANNQAAKTAKGNYLLLLNSDTIILHSAISQTLDWLSSHPESWGCTAQLLNTNKTIQPSGGYFPNLANLFTWALHLDDLPFVNSLIRPIHPHSPDFYTKEKFFTQDHTQDWITGAYMLIRQEVFNKVKGFDPTYFMYGEEMEMCARIKKQNPAMSCNYLVGPQVIHLGGASTKSKKNILQKERDGMYSFFQRHHPSWQLPIVKVLLAINQILTHA